MHEHDLWADADGKKHNQKCPRGCIAFVDCLELQKLTVFSANAAKRQQKYVQQGIRKPQWATICQFISPLEVLNRYFRYLPMLKNNPTAVATTKKGNVPFKEADLASIMLATLLLIWQNQCNLSMLKAIQKGQKKAAKS